MDGTLFLLGQSRPILGEEKPKTVVVIVCGLKMPGIQKLKTCLRDESAFSDSLWKSLVVAEAFHQKASSIVFEIMFEGEIPSTEYLLDDVGKKFQTAINLWKKN
jgi:hypothetical protein